VLILRSPRRFATSSQFLAVSCASFRSQAPPHRAIDPPSTVHRRFHQIDPVHRKLDWNLCRHRTSHPALILSQCQLDATPQHPTSTQIDLENFADTSQTSQITSHDWTSMMSRRRSIMHVDMSILIQKSYGHRFWSTQIELSHSQTSFMQSIGYIQVQMDRGSGYWQIWRD